MKLPAKRTCDLRLLYWMASNNQALGTSLQDDPKLSHINKSEKRQIYATLPPLEGLRVLELGGGIGRFSTDFAQRARSLTVVDCSEQALKKNRERNQQFTNITYVCDNVTNLRFRSDSFDLVFSNWLLMYLHEDEIRDLLQHSAAWLIDQGRFYARESCCHSYMDTRTDYFLSKKLLRSFFPFISRSIFSIWNYRFHTLRDFWTVFSNLEKIHMYREADFYENLFEADYVIEDRSVIDVYKRVFQNEEQRYWLLSHK